MPVGKSWRTSRSMPQARAAGPTRPSASATRTLDDARVFESRLDRKRVPQEVRRADHVLQGRLRSCVASCSARARPRSQPTPPGRTRPRPNRLPQSRAVALRKSPRIRPQYEAVGRKPTSPASAPISPVWLASRSSSSATPRSDCARNDGRVPASASSAWQYAVAWPTERITGDLLHEVHGPFVRAAHQGPLDAAMLITQRNLQVEDVLAVTLETEVAGLDHAGMDRPDGDLVDSWPSTRKKSAPAVDGELDRIVGRARPGVMCRAIRPMEPDRLEPRMPLGTSPHCSAISRSNQWAWGQSGVSAG